MLNHVTQKAEAHLASLIVVFHITQAEELMSRTGLKTEVICRVCTGSTCGVIMRMLLAIEFSDASRFDDMHFVVI